MARAIDGDKIVEALSLIAKCWSVSPFVSKEEHLGAVSMLREVEREVKEAPTLTQPNETPPCYQPDGDGCAYQCYDGQDEPIEKCKACPLCCSDKQRHYTPPNELTCEGCIYEKKGHENCNYCMRASWLNDYYFHPSKGENFNE